MSSLTIAQSRSWSGIAQFGRRISILFANLALAMQVRRERRMLQALDARTLKDLGFNHSDVHAEGDRTFWDLPVDRMRI
jgi:uncharacterized protein YjiS (DUF1127 family)